MKKQVPHLPQTLRGHGIFVFVRELKRSCPKILKLLLLLGNFINRDFLILINLTQKRLQNMSKYLFLTKKSLLTL